MFFVFSVREPGLFSVDVCERDPEFASVRALIDQPNFHAGKLRAASDHSRQVPAKDAFSSLAHRGVEPAVDRHMVEETIVVPV